MEFYNPFEENASQYKELIDKESQEDAVYEEITDSDTEAALGNFMSSHSSNGFSNVAKALTEARSQSKVQQENRQKEHLL